MTGNPPVDVQEYGQSIWYDNISREMIDSGELQKLLDEFGVVGMTSNPTIFEKAIGHGTAYDGAIRTMVDLPAAQIFDALSIEDIRRAADLMRSIYDRTKGGDGYISLEVSPLIASDTDKTLSEAKRLFAAVGRPNVMIKIPGTVAGLPAIEEALFAGININVTLLFSVANYVQVAERYIRALERRLDAGLPVNGIASVASFFLSRIDNLVDKQLENNIRAAQGRDIDRVAANNDLLGKTAIANAKVAYKRFKDMFYGDRFARLRDAGARVQRPLWASTGTKNPAYPDTMYLDSLIGKDTVNTVPLQTLVAFKDHGTVGPTLDKDLRGAQVALDKLAEVGIDLDLITKQLQEDGVEQFADSFRKLIAGVEGKVAQLKSGVMERQSLVLGSYQPDVDAAVAKLDAAHAVKRIWDHDATFWKSDPEAERSIASRLGWLHILDDGRIDRKHLADLQAESKSKNWKHVVLLGMGGSSLAAETLAYTFESSENWPALIVLDNTDPQAIQAVERTIDLEKTVFIVASKSGGTLETLSMQRYFYPKYASNPGAHFIAITDPGSQLEGWAKDLQFAHTFLNPADIGGRYSALSYFGLVPAALIGINLEKLYSAAMDMKQACIANVATIHHPGIWLGVVMGVLGLKGRDKVTILTGPELEAFGAWAEQLIAESTGKEGRGLVPVVGASIGNPHDHDDDRLFVYLTLDGSPNNPDEEVHALQEAGHPVVTYRLRNEFDLVGEFFRWEFATAVVGQLLGINPFDEPNVTESKNNTDRLLKEFNDSGRLPDESPVLTEDGVSLYTDEATARLLADLSAQRTYDASPLVGRIAAFLGLARSGDYIVLMAYMAQSAEYVGELSAIQRRLRHAYKRAITLGFGPRFLHSTGQLHKGGPNTGVFVQITVSDKIDPHIPGAAYGFSTLKQAQAAGDLQSLREHGRRVIRLHLGSNAVAGLRKLEDAARAAESKQK
ncbi:MAG: bifunctional transaldolase/phosoglucose isomerase [Aggregatilineales bacterium]